mmetsp:Transcript_24731/g.11834  ORF Transcript_24731/g.11834 Transcript_24731/m.11834 type:complete len:107 (-) Transcript_24731:185-505(-)
MASKLGFLRVCQVILDYGDMELLHAKDYKMRTSIHLASKKGFLSIIQLLIRSGGQVNSQDQDGNTALHFAVENAHYNLCWWLLKREADVFILNNNKKLPVELAADV